MEAGEISHSDNDTICGYIVPFSLIVHGEQANIEFRSRRYSSSRGFSASYVGLQDPFTGIPKTFSKEKNIYTNLLPILIIVPIFWLSYYLVSRFVVFKFIYFISFLQSFIYHHGGYHLATLLHHQYKWSGQIFLSMYPLAILW